MVNTINRSMRCPNCGSTNLVYLEDRGILVCESCGLVIEENMLSSEDEKRYFSPLDRINFKRTTIPKQETYLPAGQYLVQIKLSNDKIPLNTKLQRELNMCRDYIGDYCNRLRLPENIKHEALRIIAKYISRKHITQRDAPYIVSVAIFIALRNSGNYRPLDRFLRDLNLSKKKFSRIYRTIRESVSIKVRLPNAEDYVYMFAKDLQLSSTCIKIAIDILKRVKLLRPMLNKNAASLAAAAIYYASIMTGEIRSRKRIAEIAATTETTIKNRYNEIISMLNLNDKQ